MKFAPLFTLALSIFFSCESPTNPLLDKSTIMFANGNIITVDDEFHVYRNMVIRGDSILYVGNDIKFNSSSLNFIDLKGKTIMPGLIEPHTHPAASAGLYQWIDVSGFTHETAEEALNAIRKAVDKTPKGEWVLAFGWDAMLLKGAYPPYREVLDSISEDHPIWIMMQSMHSHYFNSYALELAGIDDDIKNPAGGGYYEKDENGKLTGLITESAALAPIQKVMPQSTEEEMSYLLTEQYKMYNRSGVTTIGVTGLIDALMPFAESLVQDLSLTEPKLRFYLYRIGGLDYSDREAFIENDFFKYLGNKYWADGSPYTGSMLLTSPYEASSLTKSLSIDEGSMGHIMLPLNTFQHLVTNDAAQGLQLSIHAQGDSACINTLNIYEQVLQAHSYPDHRYRMEHLALIKEEHIETMNRLGVTPSFHVNHIYYYGDFLARIVGEERASQFMPVGHAANRSMKFSLHNDSPMYPPNPFRAMQTAITRKTLNGRTLGADLAITIEEAIKAVTIYAAWQLFAEDKIGSLEVGKKADFIIIDKNPLNISPDLLTEIDIEAVFIDGREILLN